MPYQTITCFIDFPGILRFLSDHNFRLYLKNRHHKGGARIGHKGNGRKVVSLDKADEIIELPVKKDVCPDCGCRLEYKETLLRSIVRYLLWNLFYH
jgi:hypothetical protein